MPDYLYVPKVTNVLAEGVALFNRPSSGNYKVGYISDSIYTIKVGSYKDRYNLDKWVFACTERITTGFSLQCVTPIGTVIFDLDGIYNAYEDGYYNEVSYTVNSIFEIGVINVNQFTTLQETLDAFGNEAPPGPESGIVVVVNAAPTYIPPEEEGVVVYVIAKLQDPNNQGGTSTEGGGTGTFDDTSYPIPVPSLPTLSAAKAGFVTLFRPTLAELRQLGNYLWTNLTDFIDNLNKLFTNPMDYIIALNIFPCVPDVDEKQVINIGSFTTNIQMSPVQSQWYERDCGTIQISEYWGSALDYAPNTKISLFLPFIGSVQLNTDEVMGNRLGVKYRVDLLSGQCVAMVTVNDDVLYQFTGTCSVSVPLTGSDWSRIYSAAIGAVGTAITGAVAASNSVGQPTDSGPSMAGSDKPSVSLGKDFQLDEWKPSSDLAEMTAVGYSPSRSIDSTRIANTVRNTVGQVISGKLYIHHSGSVSGSSGMLGVRIPFVDIEYPNQSLAENYKHYVGYPANLSGKLSEFTGYTEVEKVIVSIEGTDEELAEIISALKGGVYL